MRRNYRSPGYGIHELAAALIHIRNPNSKLVAGFRNGQSYQTGYDKGRSDAVKQQYWLYVSMQQAKAGDDGRVRLYPVHLPEQVIDGVILQPTTQYLRIEE